MIKTRNNTITLNAPLKVHPTLKQQCDDELVRFISKIYKTDVRSDEARMLIQYAIGYLDSLCSMRFDVLTLDFILAVQASAYCVSDLSNLLLAIFKSGEEITITDAFEKMGKLPNEKLPMEKANMHFQYSDLSDVIDTVAVYDDDSTVYHEGKKVLITLPDKGENLAHILCDTNPGHFNAKTRNLLIKTLKMIVKKTSDLEDEIEEALYADEA